MARCEQGYLCEVCGQDVEEMADSDLYLRYVLGEVDPELLHRLPERHIRCNPALGQFIVADGFSPLIAEGAFAKSALDPEFVAREEKRVTRGYLRLKQLERLSLPIHEYPLPEARKRWEKAENGPAEASRTDPPSTADASEVKPQILFLDDDPDRARAFLMRHPEAVWVETAEECIARLAEEWHQVHLDHDLGGEIYVDSNRPDCGMEVVRWLCAEPRGHVESTQFIVHTHNAAAARSMLVSLRDRGYLSVYRPFGVDLDDWFAEEEESEEEEGEDLDAAAAPLDPHQAVPSQLRMSWLQHLTQAFRAAFSRIMSPTDTGSPSSSENKGGQEPWVDQPPGN